MGRIKKLLIFLFSNLFCLASSPQNKVTRLFDYHPAPGQYINTDEFGTPAAAENILRNDLKAVSLGAFGGFIILGFEKPCLNDPQNPYGVDFTIFGNAIEGSSEPGVVSVMKDSNGNGKPDDKWYEIAGSSHFSQATRFKYGLTYFRTKTRDVNWKSSTGLSGILKANSYHTQEYYPLSSVFSGYPADSVSFSPTLLEAEIVIKAGTLKSVPPAFGYADCHVRKTGTGPDNPYTPGILEGYGGDPIDISWATDSAGNYVDLASVDFVRISTGCLYSSGPLGEISTEISGILATEAGQVVPGSENLLVVYPFSDRILSGDSVRINACYFKKGRRSATAYLYSVSDGSIAAISQDGLLKTKKTGSCTISVSPADNPAEKVTKTIQVIEPARIELLNDLSALMPGDTVALTLKFYDNLDDEITGLLPLVSLSGDNTAKIIQINKQFRLVALSPGNSTLTVKIPGYSVQLTSKVNILDQSAQVKVYLTIMATSGNLLPLQWVTIPLASLNQYVDSRKGDYNLATRPSAAHVITAGLQKAGTSFRFRENGTQGGGLYLYSVEKEGIFTYGWGGKTDPAAYARTWMVRVGNKQYFTGLEGVNIKQGDTVTVYHVPELLKDWDLNLLIPSAAIVQTGTGLSVSALKIICRLTGQTVFESLQAKIPNAEVIVETDNKKNTLITDDEGQIYYTPLVNKPVSFSSGNNAVLVAEKQSTGIKINRQPEIYLFPNPVTRELTITGLVKAGSSWRISGMTGQALLTGNAESYPARVDVSCLKTGLYMLQLAGNGKSETLKFIKK